MESLTGYNIGAHLAYAEPNYAKGSIIERIVLSCECGLTDKLTCH